MALKNIGVLWKKKNKDNKVFLSGILNNGIHGDIHIMIFANDAEDRKEKSPDYRIVMSTDDDRQDRPAKQGGGDDFLADDVQAFPDDSPVIDVADDPGYL
jgi:hypothetical protein